MLAVWWWWGGGGGGGREGGSFETNYQHAKMSTLLCSEKHSQMMRFPLQRLSGLMLEQLRWLEILELEGGGMGGRGEDKGGV